MAANTGGGSSWPVGVASVRDRQDRDNPRLVVNGIQCSNSTVAAVNVIVYRSGSSVIGGLAGGQVSRELLPGEYPSGTHTGQALPELTDQFGVRQHSNRLLQSVQLTRGGDVGNVITVRDDRDRLATFGPAHDLSPRRLILGAKPRPGSLTNPW